MLCLRGLDAKIRVRVRYNAERPTIFDGASKLAIGASEDS